MRSRNYTDIIAGGLLTGLGVAIFFYARATLRMGTVAQMGPGMFPAALGVLLAVLGLIVFLPALRSPGSWPKVDWRPMTMILASVLAFSVALVWFGLVPAVMIQTLISSRSESRLTWLGALTLALVLAFSAVAIFVWGLGLYVPLFNWPWWG